MATFAHAQPQASSEQVLQVSNEAKVINVGGQSSLTSSKQVWQVSNGAMVVNVGGHSSLAEQVFHV